VIGVGEGEGDGEGDGDGEACGCASPVCATTKKNMLTSHTKAQKAQKILLKRFVSFVPCGGLISSLRRVLVFVLR
jgi:hypothetical protein